MIKDKLVNLCGNEHQRANTQGRAPPPFSAWCISPDLTPKRFFSTPMHCNDEWDVSDVCSHFDLILQWLNICLPGDQHCPVGGFLLRKVFDIRLCMFPSCFRCFTGLRTYFVSSVAQLLPMLVKNFRLQWEFQWENDQKIKWPKITFPGSKMVPKVSKWGF